MRVDMRLYPWGNTPPEPSIVSSWLDRTPGKTERHGLWHPKPVGSYPGGASPYGAEDMAGSVVEWAIEDPVYRQVMLDLYPHYNYGDCEEVYRGGSGASKLDMLTTFERVARFTCRNRDLAPNEHPHGLEDRRPDVGFRRVVPIGDGVRQEPAVAP